MEISTRQFDIPEVSSAFGVPFQTIHTWRRRGYLVGLPGVGASQGKRVILSYQNAIEIGVAHALLMTGMPDGGGAFVASRAFAHFGPGPVEGLPARQPGLPFHHKHGETFIHFVAASGASWESLGSDTFAHVDHALHKPDGFVTVNASAVFRRLCAFLSVDYRVVLDEEYSDEAAR